MIRCPLFSRGAAKKQPGSDSQAVHDWCMVNCFEAISSIARGDDPSPSLSSPLSRPLKKYLVSGALYLFSHFSAYSTR